MLGGKTGFTDDAGRCLVASAERGGRRLVAVALGSQNAFPDVRALLEYGFSDLVRARLVTEGAVVSTATPAPAATPAPSSTGAPAATAAPGEAVRVGATVDALVRRDLLGRVRVSLRAGSGTPTAVLRAGDRVLASVAAEAAPAGTAAAPVTPRALPAGAEPAPIDPALVGGDTPSAGG
jgi:D-alanyl-D-alanine carboxypeptidase (penicillin-binding protein 5/6)